MSQTRRLAAILAADVAGYSRLMGSGRGRHARTPQSAAPRAPRSENRRASGPHRQDHRRRPAGGICQASSTRSAAQSRCSRQCRAEHGCRGGQPHRIAYRHQSRRRDRRGRRTSTATASTIAARIEALADAGGVFVSNTVHDHVPETGCLSPSRISASQQVKNITRPVRVYRVRDAAAGQEPIPLGATLARLSRRSRCCRFRTSAATRNRNTSPTAWSRHHHRAVAVPRAVRDRTQQHIHLQG